jgi:hypothetical protein
MSGGSFGYHYMDLSVYHGQMEDTELDEMIKDLADVLHDLEWYASSDYSEDIYRKTVQAFKDKWFGKRDERIRDLLIKELDDVKNRIIKL